EGSAPRRFLSRPVCVRLFWRFPENASPSSWSAISAWHGVHRPHLDALVGATGRSRASPPRSVFGRSAGRPYIVFGPLGLVFPSLPPVPRWAWGPSLDFAAPGRAGPSDPHCRRADDRPAISAGHRVRATCL